MAQHYDVSLKALFARDGDGIIRRLLFGGKIIDYLATEQPQVSNRRADMLVRIEDGILQQVEFQASNESGFTLRMLEYYTYFLRAHGEHVKQVVLYLGPKPMGLERTLKTPSMDYQFEVINLREFDAGPLVASPDWADNVLAILAKGDPEEALRAVMPRLRGMTGDERDWASGTLLLLSGIIGFAGKVKEQLKEAGMIDLMENEVLGPMLRQQFAEGKAEGKVEGKKEGLSQRQLDILHSLLVQKFGPLPRWAESRLTSASDADVEMWVMRVVPAATLEEALRN